MNIDCAHLDKSPQVHYCIIALWVLQQKKMDMQCMSPSQLGGGYHRNPNCNIRIID